MSALDEFSLIQRYFTSSLLPASVLLGVGDDCALLQLPPDEVLAVSVDTQVSGVHFPTSTAPRLLGARALHCAASDLAAMGAVPLGFTLALTMPDANEVWLSEFSAGLLTAAATLQCPLIGGDTTRGPLSVGVQVHGSVPPASALRRSGARVGDDIWVSDTLGDGAAALAMLEGRLTVSADAADWLHRRFFQPDVAIDLGVALRGVATACIDVSDGLLADLGHLVRASGVAASVALVALPLSPVWCSATPLAQAQQWALTGGDDYRLCFTAPPVARAAVQAAWPTARCVGSIVTGTGVQLHDETGASVVLSSSGFRHF